MEWGGAEREVGAWSLFPFLMSALDGECEGGGVVRMRRFGPALPHSQAGGRDTARLCRDGSCSFNIQPQAPIKLLL